MQAWKEMYIHILSSSYSNNRTSSWNSMQWHAVDDCHQMFSSRTFSLESQNKLPCTLEMALPLLYSPYANSAMKHLWFRTTSDLPGQPK